MVPRDCQMDPRLETTKRTTKLANVPDLASMAITEMAGGPSSDQGPSLLPPLFH